MACLPVVECTLLVLCTGMLLLLRTNMLLLSCTGMLLLLLLRAPLPWTG
jgi:hypothetical protein